MAMWLGLSSSPCLKPASDPDAEHSGLGCLRSPATEVGEPSHTRSTLGCLRRVVVDSAGPKAAGTPGDPEASWDDECLPVRSRCGL